MLAGASLATLALISPPSPSPVSGQIRIERPSEPSAPLHSSLTEQVGAGGSRTSIVTVGLEVIRAGAERPALALRGHRTSPGSSGTFEVGASISRIPCSGKYRFEAGQENAGNGNSATYDALIRLFDLEASPPGARCGVPAPPLPGSVRVFLGVREGKPLFALRGDRRGAGAFKGGLSFVSFPECGRAYRLQTALDLAGWSRSFDFKVRVLEVDAAIQGKVVLDERC